MTLVKWTPFREMLTLQDRMNRLFNGSEFRPSHWDDDMAMTNWHPVVDIYDNDDMIVIKAELPGVDKKDIKVDVNGRILTLKGESSTDNEVKEENQNGK